MAVEDPEAAGYLEVVVGLEGQVPHSQMV